MLEPKRPYERPVYRDHTEIPPGTLVFKETVLQIFPGSVPSFHRELIAGKFPPPTRQIGRRPAWNIDIVRKYASGEWQPEGQGKAA